MKNPWDNRERLEWLLAPRRQTWFPRAPIVLALELGEGAAVADVGAGSGYLVEELAVAVGLAGRVWAVDPSPQARALLTERFQDEAHRQVVVRDGTAAATGLVDRSADGMVWLAIYHELLHATPDGEELHRSFAEARRVLKPGGRLVIGDWRPVPTEVGPPTRERVDPERAGQALTAAGFTVASSTNLSEAVWLLTVTTPDDEPQ
ncbi:MAG: class I SAM-dependent methyltransferase [Thermaerobacter sp.]|nr:class I SAM-dependent methyltransferase [Thermaerobacter sp.]